MIETRIQICTEKLSNKNCPVLYDGKFNEMDFINKDVLAGEMLQSLLNKFKDYDITPENLNKTIDKGQRVIIKFWKEESPNQ